MSTSIQRATTALALLLVAMLFGCDSTEEAEIAPLGDGTVYACRYENPFSKVNECRGYFGGWAKSRVDEECGAVFTGVAGTVSEDPCVDGDAIGICTSNVDEQGLFFKIWFYGGESAVTGRLCGEFLNGTWQDIGGGDSPPPMMTTPLEDALEYMVSTPDVTVTPECTDDACLDVLVESVSGIEFRPVDVEVTTGFIVYPGAQVDPRAYAPLAYRLARQGILTVIVPMPGLFALNGWDRATAMMEARPSVGSWYLGGHSMGGAMTAHFAKENPGVMNGLVLWAAYAGGGDDLSETAEVVMSIYGNSDGVATVEEVEDGKMYLPPDTQYVEIRGGNHAQFGMYGDQDGDNEADLPIEVQHQQIVGATAYFIRSTELSEPVGADPAFQSAPTTAWCEEAQRIIAGLSDPIMDSDVEVITYDVIEEYARSKPSLDQSVEIPLKLSAYVRDQGNAERLDAPPIMPREVWCKLKSQMVIAEQMGVIPAVEQGTCADVNAAVMVWASQQLSGTERAQLEGLQIQFSYLEDEEFETGLEWLGDGSLLIEDLSTEGERAYAIRSSSLKVGDQADVPEDERIPEAYRNVVYCKLLAPAEALRWVRLILAPQ